MKKLYKTFLIIVTLLLIAGCSSTSGTSTFSVQPKEISTYDLMEKVNDHIHYGALYFTSYNIIHDDLIPFNKRKKLYEKLGIKPVYGQTSSEEFNMDGTPAYGLDSIIDVIATPEYGAKVGDTVTFSVAVNEYMLKEYYGIDNLTLEEVEEALGVKFIPYNCVLEAY